MKPRLLFALFFGVAVLAAVLLRFDISLVMVSLARAGWSGFAFVVAAGLAAEIVLAIGIWPLLPQPAPFLAIVASRQLRDSTADVLPITQLGGLAFAARALVLAGLRASDAAA